LSRYLGLSDSEIELVVDINPAKAISVTK
jgi:hypothetical protein